MESRQPQTEEWENSRSQIIPHMTHNGGLCLDLGTKSSSGSSNKLQFANSQLESAGEPFLHSHKSSLIISCYTVEEGVEIENPSLPRNWKVNGQCHINWRMCYLFLHS